MSSEPYSLAFHEDALAEWRALDAGIRAALKRKLERRLVEPHVPAALLGGELAGFYKIRHNRPAVRLVYGVDEECHRVVVYAVGPRDGLAAYRAASERG